MGKAVGSLQRLQEAKKDKSFQVLFHHFPTGRSFTTLYNYHHQLINSPRKYAQLTFWFIYQFPVSLVDVSQYLR